jgi:polysaccharide chain length determinant protein (PEP-CTERM system associated)
VNTSQEFDIFRILDPIYRRKELAVAIFLVVTILAAYLAMTLPDIYRSSTLILITPQKLPPNYVASTDTLSVEQRVRTITEAILSRTSLERIVRRFNLFPPNGGEATIEERVKRLRKDVTIDTAKSDTFKLSFVATTPKEAMEVTARLASLFIDENLKSREQQASATTAFINTEAQRLRKELEQQESQLNLYKLRFRGELPEQLDANLRTLEQLRRERESGMFRLTVLEERKSSLEKQMAESERSLQGSPMGANGGGIEDRKRELELLLMRYSEKHPDVIRLKQEIEQLSAENSTRKPGTKQRSTSRKRGSRSSLDQVVSDQIDDIAREEALLRRKNDLLQSDIVKYQAYVDNAPLRAIELAKITRNYDITRKKFQELLSKSFDSQLSENMEIKQKGQQFQIIDPAALPQRPFAPNRQRILLVGLLAGLAGGCSAAYFLETMTTSFKRGEDFDGYTNLPLLGVLPAVPTRKSVLEQRLQRMILIVASTGALALGVWLIQLFGPSLPIH